MLYISHLDVLAGSSTQASSTQAELDLAKMQSKAPPKKKTLRYFNIETTCFFIDEIFDSNGGKKPAYGKVDTVGQLVFSFAY